MTNELLTKSINNNIVHFKTLGDRQGTNTNRLAAQLNTLRQSVDNNALWLGNIHDRLQESNGLLEQNLNKTIEINFPTIQIDAGNTLLQQILDELCASADEGWIQYVSGNASTTPTTYDFIKDYAPHHAVKGILIRNDGTTAIKVSILSPTTQSEFKLNSLESQPITFNRNVIRKVFITAVTGTPAYRMWYSW